MFKKALAAVTALTFIFGITSQPNLNEKISTACSYMCCEHNGDLWSN